MKDEDLNFYIDFDDELDSIFTTNLRYHFKSPKPLSHNKIKSITKINPKQAIRKYTVQQRARLFKSDF